MQITIRGTEEQELQNTALNVARDMAESEVENGVSNAVTYVVDNRNYRAYKTGKGVVVEVKGEAKAAARIKTL